MIAKTILLYMQQGVTDSTNHCVLNSFVMFMWPCDEYPLFYPNIQWTMNIIGFIHAESTYLFIQ